MKNVYLSIVALLGIGSAMAQTTALTSSSIPGAGELFNRNHVGNFNPGPTGQGQTWDFSALMDTLAGDTSFVLSYVAPSSTGSAAMFTSSNLASHLGAASASNSYDYFINDTSELEWTGTFLNGVPIAFNSPVTILTFPFTYANSVTDTGSAAYSYSSSDFKRRFTVTTTADGAGTLKLFQGIFTNVLRVKTIIDQVDSASANFGELLAITKITKYEWFEATTKDPILSYNYTHSVITVSGAPFQTIDANAHSARVNALGILKTAKNEFKFYVSPNPAKNNIRINLTAIKKGNLKIDLYNALGEKVKSIYDKTVYGKVNESIDITDVKSGLYFIVSNLGGVQSTEKLVVE